MTATTKRYPLYSLGGSSCDDIIRKRALRRPSPDQCVPRMHTHLLSLLRRLRPCQELQQIFSALIDYHSLGFFVHSGYQSPLGLKGSIYYLLFPHLYAIELYCKNNIKQYERDLFRFGFPLLLAGLFGLVFLLLLANKGKGKKGKTTPTSSGGGGGLESCATAGCQTVSPTMKATSCASHVAGVNTYFCFVKTVIICHLQLCNYERFNWLCGKPIPVYSPPTHCILRGGWAGSVGRIDWRSGLCPSMVC